MKIKVLAAFRDINNFKLQHEVGEVFDCQPDSRAEKIVELGYAEFVKTEEEKPAPEKPVEVEEQVAPSPEVEEPKDEVKVEAPAEEVVETQTEAEESEKTPEVEEPAQAKRGRKPNTVD